MVDIFRLLQFLHVKDSRPGSWNWRNWSGHSRYTEKL